MKRNVPIILMLLAAGFGSRLVFAQAPELLNSERSSEFLPPERISNNMEEGLSREVSLDLRGMDIIETIKFLATKGNLNMVASKNVQGKVTLFLKNVAISDVMDVILLTNNLACEKNNDIITIMTDAEHEALYGQKYSDKKQLKVISLKYVSAEKAGNLLSGIKSNIGKVIIDEKTGTVILIDIPEKIKEMEETAARVDLPTVDRVFPTVRETFELEYANVKDVESQITKSLTEGVGTVRIDERTNKLIVTDLPHNMKAIRELIKDFDAKTRQVFIEAKIMEITLSDDTYTGVDWKKIFAEAHNMALDSTFPFAYTGASSLALSIGTIAADEYEAVLTLIKTIGKTTILSSPHIAVCNNEEAAFMVGSREAYVTSTVTTGEATTTTSESVEFIDVGVTLHVTPVINKDGFIKMHIKPEVSSVRDWLETSEGGKIPIVDTSNIKTDILIKDGRTIIIAGFIKETDTEGIDKVPLLGDIPALGGAFKRTSNKKEKKELVMFLTPHIISGEENQLSFGK